MALRTDGRAVAAVRRSNDGGWSAETLVWGGLYVLLALVFTVGGVVGAVYAVTTLAPDSAVGTPFLVVGPIGAFAAGPILARTLVRTAHARFEARQRTRSGRPRLEPRERTPLPVDETAVSRR